MGEMLAKAKAEEHGEGKGGESSAEDVARKTSYKLMGS